MISRWILRRTVAFPARLVNITVGYALIAGAFASQGRSICIPHFAVILARNHIFQYIISGINFTEAILSVFGEFENAAARNAFEKRGYLDSRIISGLPLTADAAYFAGFAGLS